MTEECIEINNSREFNRFRSFGKINIEKDDNNSSMLKDKYSKSKKDKHNKKDQIEITKPKNTLDQNQLTRDLTLKENHNSD